jgi:hypothetical protein
LPKGKAVIKPSGQWLKCLRRARRVMQRNASAVGGADAGSEVTDTGRRADERGISGHIPGRLV